MRNFVLFFLLLMLLMSFPVSADGKFEDIPDDHWASEAVYDLVKLGVTKGYPDGTFRGNRNISRYETAVFLSKLADAIGGSGVRAEITALKDQIAEIKESGADRLPISGSYQSDIKFANILSSSGVGRGAVANYRLKLSTRQNLGDGAEVTIGLDTMDYGFYGTGTAPDLATDLLDIESSLKLDLSDLGIENPVDLTVTYGPGARVHVDSSGVLSSEVGRVYVRPDPAVMVATEIWGMDVSGGYVAKELANSGRITVSEIIGTIGYTLQGVPFVDILELEATGDYISAGMFSSSSRDMRGSIVMAAPLGEKIEASTTLGLGGSASQNIMLAGEVVMNDVLDSGTDATVRVSKIGSEYISTNATFAGCEFDLAGLDTFDRALENGTVNLGAELVQNVSEDVKLIGKGDLRLNSNYAYEAPNGRMTAQGSVSYSVAPNTNLDAMYRIHQDKSTSDTTDMTAVGLLYNF